MVVKQHTAKRARARRKSQGKLRIENGRPAEPGYEAAPGPATAAVDSKAGLGLDPALLSRRLSPLLHDLARTLSTLVVCIEALRRQNADADTDIASVLQQHVGDQLDISLEQLMQLIEYVERHKPRVEEGAKAA